MSYLNNTTLYTKASHEDYIVGNITNMLAYGMLEIGAFYNITLGQLDEVGNDVSYLRVASAQNVTPYTQYNSNRQWVWETGVTMADPAAPTPISVSGIYCNNIFYPTGTKVLGTGYYIDYRSSKVVFEYPVTGSIRMERAERGVNIYSADADIYRQILQGYRTFNSSIAGSGNDLIAQNTRGYLPCVAVGVHSFTSTPIEIGSRSKWVNARVSFDIFANNASDRKRLASLIYMLEDKSFKSYDPDLAPARFNNNGSLASTALTFPILSNSYSRGDMKFKKDGKFIKNDKSLPLQYANVSISVETPVHL